MRSTLLSAQNTFLGLSTAALLLLASPLAHAGFTNGGFETGDFTGWTLEYGMNYGVANLADPVASVDWTNVYSTVTPIVVDKSVYSDSYVPSFASRFVGDKMAKINDIDGNDHVTRLSQTGTIDASDLNGGTSATVYVNWISVMDNPSHPADANPWFNIEITKNGFSVYNVTHFSDQAGWAQTGTYWSDPVYMSADQVQLSNLQLGDVVSVKMTVADCGYGGHGAYAYLDGIGTSQVPNPNATPDTASTLALLGLGIAGLLGLKRRRA